MAKRRQPIEDSLAEELYEKFLMFIHKNGAIPVVNAFWSWLILRNHYTRSELPEHTCRYQFRRLELAGWIEVEPDTGAISPQRNVKITVNT
jgi:hypothetical protein